MNWNEVVCFEIAILERALLRLAIVKMKIATVWFYNI